jgi:hypothetical protein
MPASREVLRAQIPWRPTPPYRPQLATKDDDDHDGEEHNNYGDAEQDDVAYRVRLLGGGGMQLRVGK